MAKKKAAAGKKGKAAKQAPAAQSKTKPGKGKGGIVFIALFVFFAAIAVEIYFVAQKSARDSKRPVLLTSFEKSYGGITSMGEYGQHIYVTDGERGEVRKINKADGKIIQIMEVKDGAITTVENMQGMTYVLSRANTLIIFNENMKEVKRVVLTGVGNGMWIDIDKEDNIYIADDSAGKIHKFDKDFKKVLEFGGRGSEKGQFTGLSKMHIALSGDIYAFDNLGGGVGRMQVFDKAGKVKLVYKVDKLKRISHLENFVVTPDGSAYFNDFEGSCVVVYGPKGAYMGKFDTDAAKRVLVTYPATIAGGPSGMIYVATHRLTVFAPIKY